MKWGADIVKPVSYVNIVNMVLRSGAEVSLGLDRYEIKTAFHRLLEQKLSEGQRAL